MKKQTETEPRKIRQQIFQGESSMMDKGALACDIIMLCIFIWNQIRYGMQMLYFIIPLAFLGVYLALNSIYAEEYCFTVSALEIRHKFRKTISIPYEAVFNYESSSKDSFINIMQSNKVKVYCMHANKKKAIICMPKDVESFVETLKWNCPEFQEESKEKSKLEVFFDNK